MYLKRIPEDEHWNLFFTVADVKEEPGRLLHAQNVIPFDIDDVEPGKEQAVIDAAFKALKLDPEKTAYLFSGHGVQFFVQTPLVITRDTEFNDMRKHYKTVCTRINMELLEHNLKGLADTSVWSAARIMRLPGTINRKEDQPDVQARLIQSVLEVQDWSLEDASGLIDLAPRDVIRKEVFNKIYSSPDTKAVQEGCGFLRHVKGSSQVAEPEWYAALGILSYLPESEKLAVEYAQASKRSDYSDEKTIKKLYQAHEATSGPRTCVNIRETIGFTGCAQCPHFGKVTTPLAICGPDFIRTEKNGFHSVTVTKDGQIKTGRPEIDDLVKFWRRSHRHVSHTGNLWVKGPTHWKQMDKYHLLAFAQTHFDPKPDTYTATEFLNAVLRDNVVDHSFWDDGYEETINLQNGVLDMTTLQLRPHQPTDRFKYVLPYDWNPGCECTLFERFLNDIACGDQEIVKLLWEFIGYILSNVKPYAQRMLYMVGDGSNGKSTFLNILRKLCGENSVSSVSLFDLGNKNSLRFLDGSLANLTGEADKLDIRLTNILKELVTGGLVSAKALYKDEYTFACRAKFVIAGNDNPYTADKNDGFLRRIIFVPMKATFDAESTDIFLEEKITTVDSLSGILNKACQHYQDLKARRYKFIEPKTSKDEKVEFRADNDPVVAFWEESIVACSPDVRTDKKDIFNEFKFWAEENNVQHRMSSSLFWKRARRYVIRIREVTVRENFGRQYRCLEGVKIRKETDL